MEMQSRGPAYVRGRVLGWVWRPGGSVRKGEEQRVGAQSRFEEEWGERERTRTDPDVLHGSRDDGIRETRDGSGGEELN